MENLRSASAARDAWAVDASDGGWDEIRQIIKRNGGPHTVIVCESARHASSFLRRDDVEQKLGGLSNCHCQRVENVASHQPCAKRCSYCDYASVGKRIGD